MALPMLVGGADCGPSNALQGLSKKFDQDRSLQQDHFGAGRSEVSRETFRTQHTSAARPDQDAARFFSSAHSPTPQYVSDSVYDVSALRGALTSHLRTPLHPPQMQQPSPLAAWASDFAQQQPIKSLTPDLMNITGMSVQQDASAANINVQRSGPSGGMQWNSTFMGTRMNSFAPAIPMQAHRSVVASSQISWDREFSTQEMSLAPLSSTPSQDVQATQPIQRQTPQEADELARTAGLLLENIKDEQNPKFQNSQFMGLMKQLRDGTVVVEGNQMVENDGHSTVSSAPKADVKGKGRALDTSSFAEQSNAPLVQNMNSALGNGIYSDFRGAATRELATVADAQTYEEQSQEWLKEEANDAYFRQENADYIRYWDELEAPNTPHHSVNAEVSSWDKLQEDWDKFEATATGMRAPINYQFQSNNPYLIGDSSRTRNHALHSDVRQSFFESVLELEAAVQRDANDASAWFELGVKQQENEREQKAIQALQRALDLDPLHLPTWLALAISYTNDNNRLGAYNAIREWVTCNDRYKAAVLQFRAQTPEDPTVAITERYGHLIQCLIAMARSDVNGEVDADIQIALAVLLNTNEDYEKAQDCFSTALAVRPQDWLLYNRVGATMANSGHAEDAIHYYYKALELNPGYIRARFNLGISCINLRRYEEAAQHILDALVLQDSDGVHDPAGLNDKRGVTSTALWDSLKTACLHMQRVDLATLCDRQDLEAFRINFHM